MTDEDAWRMEERFWTGGEDHRREVLDPACVMAFPPSAGIIQGPGIAQSLAGAPRRSSVTMAETHAAPLGGPARARLQG